jgi:spore maturation protein CgeB
VSRKTSYAGFHSFFRSLLDSFFAPGEEIFVVESAADVVAALRCPEGELARLARRAHQRTMQEHTGMNRARELVEILQGTRWASAEERNAGRGRAEKSLPLITGTER